MGVEQAVFKGLLTAAKADTGGSGLYGETSANRLYGGFKLQGEDMRTHDLPRIEVAPPINSRMDASGQDIWTGLWRMRVMVQRDRAFGTGDTPENAGVLSGIMDRVNAVFDKATITLGSGTASTLSINRVIPGPENENTVVRIIEFTILVCE